MSKTRVATKRETRLGGRRRAAGRCVGRRDGYLGAGELNELKATADERLARRHGVALRVRCAGQTHDLLGLGFLGGVGQTPPDHPRRHAGAILRRREQQIVTNWADARVMEEAEAEALLRSFGLDNTRPRLALEEGWMLRALRDEHGLKQQELATRLERPDDTRDRDTINIRDACATSHGTRCQARWPRAPPPRGHVRSGRRGVNRTVATRRRTTRNGSIRRRTPIAQVNSRG